VFHQYEPRHFIDAIDRGLQAYRDTKSWAILRGRGMREDNSWSNAAEQYAGIYQWALNVRG
jgi:starch synthase